MNFLVWSDLHEEVKAFGLPVDQPSGIDAVLVAGDTWTKGRSIQKLEPIAEWAGVPVVATAGNHEYYGDSIFRSDLRMAREADESRFDIRFLNPGSTMIGDCRIVGATLWTDYRLRYPTGDNWLARNACHNGMNDHARIRWGDGNFRKIRPEDLEQLHARHKSFIRDILVQSHEGPTVVMTHHAPSGQSVKYRGNEELLQHAYASNLENLILDYQPEIWIHGHTHNPEDYRIGDTRVISNPRGYGDNPEFDPLRVYTVECDMETALTP